MKQSIKDSKEKRLPTLIRAIGAAAVLSIAVVGSAGAANINSLIVSGPNQLSDEDREYLIDRIQPLDDNGAPIVGQVDVGDSLRGLINFNTINSGSANLGGLTGNDEFTGVFQVLVVAAIRNPINPADTLVAFQPDPAFGTYLQSLGIPVLGGEIAALFTDPSINFCADFDDAASCALLGGGTDDGTAGRTVPPSSADVGTGLLATEEAFIGTAVDGLFWATVGFLGLPGEAVAGNGPTSILDAFALTSGSSAGNINAGMNLISTGAGFSPSIEITRTTASPFGDCDPAPGIQVGSCKVDFAFSQQLRGISDLDTPFEIATNTNVSFNAVPEPGTLGLLGLSLVGLAGLRRRFMKF